MSKHSVSSCRRKREREELDQEVGLLEGAGDIREVDHLVLIDLVEVYTEEVNIQKMIVKKMQLTKVHKKKWKDKEKCKPLFLVVLM